MQALEQPEQFVGVRHVKAHAVVADKPGICIGRPPHRDARLSSLGRVLQPVVDEVEHQQAQQRRIATRQRHGLDVHFRRRIGRSQRADRVLGHGGQIHLDRCDVGPHHFEQFQQVGDHHAHSARGIGDACEQLTSVGAEAIGLVSGNQRCKPIDCAQRATQIVGNRVRQCLHIVHGALQLQRSLGHPLFKRFVQQAHLFAPLAGGFHSLHKRRHVGIGAHKTTTRQGVGLDLQVTALEGTAHVAAGHAVVNGPRA